MANVTAIGEVQAIVRRAISYHRIPDGKGGFVAFGKLTPAIVQSYARVAAGVVRAERPSLASSIPHDVVSNIAALLCDEYSITYPETDQMPEGC